jgi:translation initiation factor IF-2
VSPLPFFNFLIFSLPGAIKKLIPRVERERPVRGFNLFKGVICMSEEKVGKVIKFFARPSVAAVEVTEGVLSVGDSVRIRGHSTDFDQEIVSMEVDNQPVDRAEKGQMVGIKVKDRVRPNDQIFKVT